MAKLIVKDEILQKRQLLENAATILKKEFVGIDSIIDNVISNISSWYVLPELQEKPVIINLWGLTGVGKTSLVNRLVELLDYHDKFYRFDLGEKEGSFSFRETLDDMCEHEDKTPLVIALDEFQHSRIIDEMGNEIQADKNRMVWELVDSGKMLHYEWKSGLYSFSEMIRKLEGLIQAGIDVQGGFVVKDIALYKKEMEIEPEENEPVWFVPESFHRDIIEYAGRKFKLELVRDVENLLKQMDESDSLRFLYQVHRCGLKPSNRDFSKSLIFVLGNLDEAYKMSNNFSADIDADEFHELTLKINLPKIKKALQKRFRNEQIARLGNIHVIYPALNSQSYKRIIQLELNKIEKSLYSSFNIRVEFDKSVNRLIYDEGVFPVQGTRPIYTSIHQIIKSKISNFITEILIKDIKVNSIHFHIEANILIGQYLYNQNIVHELKTPIVTNLEQIRANTKDDRQAITAVHESGHAILSAVLLDTIPEVVYSKTADADAEGFVYSKIKWEFISKKSIVPRTAMILGGLVAERLVFGDDNITTGAESDIHKATEFLGEMFKKSGMGSIQGNFAIKSSNTDNLLHNYDFLESEIKSTIQKAISLAETTLTKEMDLLIYMSDFLSDNRVLRKEKLEQLIRQYSISSKELICINNADNSFYRNFLKSKVREHTQKHNRPVLTTELILNKGEK